MIEKIISVQDMIAICLIVGVLIKWVQRREKW